MNRDGFKIICNNCGNTINVNNLSTKEECERLKFYFLPVQSDSIIIGCENCNSDAHIKS